MSNNKVEATWHPNTGSQTNCECGLRFGLHFEGCPDVPESSVSGSES